MQELERISILNSSRAECWRCKVSLIVGVRERDYSVLCTWTCVCVSDIFVVRERQCVGNICGEREAVCW